MEFNGFVVQVRGHADRNQYVQVAHGQPLAIELRNGQAVPVTATVNVCGHNIATLRMEAGGTAVVDRAMGVALVYYREGSPELAGYGRTFNRDQWGLIDVSFRPQLDERAMRLFGLTHQPDPVRIVLRIEDAPAAASPVAAAPNSRAISTPVPPRR